MIEPWLFLLPFVGSPCTNLRGSDEEDEEEAGGGGSDEEDEEADEEEQDVDLVEDAKA